MNIRSVKESINRIVIESKSNRSKEGMLKVHDNRTIPDYLCELSEDGTLLLTVPQEIYEHTERILLTGDIKKTEGCIFTKE